jgi:hypothetical protein
VTGGNVDGTIEFLFHDGERHSRRRHRARAELDANPCEVRTSPRRSTEVFGGVAGVVADEYCGRRVLRADISADGLGREAHVGEGEFVCDNGAPA